MEFIKNIMGQRGHPVRQPSGVTAIGRADRGDQMRTKGPMEDELFEWRYSVEAYVILTGPEHAYINKTLWERAAVMLAQVFYKQTRDELEMLRDMLFAERWRERDDPVLVQLHKCLETVGKR